MANNFKLTLDTLAPVGSIARPGDFLNENAALSINKGDATHMKVWFDTKAAGDKADVTAQEWELAAQTKITAFTADGNYYYHLLLKDDVANESVVYNTEIITFDKALPVVEAFTIMDKDSNSTTLTNERVIKFNLKCSDNLSGVAAAYITGDYIDSVTVASGDIVNNEASGEIKIKDTAPQGSISVSIKLVDNAGNESLVTTKSIVLDTNVGTPSIVLTKDGTETIAENSYINYHAVTANVTLADTDVVGYKIWEITEPSSYTEYNNANHDKAFSVKEAITLSANDGAKTVYAKLIDASGTATSEISYTINIDTVDPVVELSAPLNDESKTKTLISDKAGYSSVELTMKGTDASAGVKSYTLKVGETVLASDSGKDAPVSFTINNTHLVEGNNTITLEVIDNAENTNSASVVVELDTAAPTFEVPALNTWYTEVFGKQFTYTETNAISKVYAWTNTKTTDTEAPADAVNVTAANGTINLSADDIRWSLVQSANNYLHIKIVDEVGNAAYKSYKFGFDSIISTDEIPAGSIRFEKTAYNGELNAKALITYNDADVSGIDKMKVTGDITNPSSDWEDVASTKSITLTSGDEQKTIYVQFKDVAGNVSPIFESTNKAEVDTSAPTVGITLYKADGNTLKTEYSAEATTVITLTVSDDTIGIVEDSNVEYRVWGDFEGSDDTKWETLVMDAGKASKSITVTVTDATAEKIAQKNFNAQIRDKVGNVSKIATASFQFDPTAPTAEVIGLDHNRISKVNAARFCEEMNHGTISSYADEVKFTIQPSEIIKEWKVCAYADEAAALAGSAADAAIGNANGSLNVSGETNSSNTIACMIKGADYEIAVGGRASESGEFDGIHYVVVYVKNEADLWSAKYIKA